uniref:Uncharacterized protein n=1 Tax=Timema tahoe TaxID=61484 RepID=A0A7R9IB46_9NEOP|nr:unnamed protein product [Timema tahoe]
MEDLLKLTKALSLRENSKHDETSSYSGGSNLDDETFSYFTDIFQLSNTSKLVSMDRMDSLEGLTVKGVFDRIQGKELFYCSSHIGALVIEKMLDFANDKVLERFFLLFEENLQTLLHDPYASLVLMKLVYIAAGRGKTEPKTWKGPSDQSPESNVNSDKAVSNKEPVSKTKKGDDTGNSLPHSGHDIVKLVLDESLLDLDTSGKIFDKSDISFQKDGGGEYFTKKYVSDTTFHKLKKRSISTGKEIFSDNKFNVEQSKVIEEAKFKVPLSPGHNKPAGSLSKPESSCDTSVEQIHTNGHGNDDRNYIDDYDEYSDEDEILDISVKRGLSFFGKLASFIFPKKNETDDNLNTENDIVFGRDNDSSENESKGCTTDDESASDESKVIDLDELSKILKEDEFQYDGVSMMQGRGESTVITQEGANIDDESIKVSSVVKTVETRKSGDRSNEGRGKAAKRLVGKEVMVLRRSKFSCGSWFLKVARFALNNLEEFMWNPYAAQVVEEVLHNLSVSEHTGCPSLYYLDNAYPIASQENINLLVQFADKFLSWPELAALAYNEVTAHLLKTLLNALSEVRSDTTQKLAYKLLSDCFAYDEHSLSILICFKSRFPSIKRNYTKGVNRDHSISVLPAFENMASSQLFNSVIYIASPELLNEIHKRCFKGRLLQLSLTELAVPLVNNLLDHCTDLDQMEEMYNELGENFEILLDKRHTSILVHLAEACCRLKVKQGCFQEHMMQALHCLSPPGDPKLFVSLLLSLQPEENILEDGLESFVVEQDGAQILINMFQFTRPMETTANFLQMAPEEMLILLNDSNGPSVLNAFLSSKYIEQACKASLVPALKASTVVRIPITESQGGHLTPKPPRSTGYLSTLACSQFGSTSLQFIWENGTLADCLTMVEELSLSEKILNKDECGSAIAVNFGLFHYGRSVQEWRNWYKETHSLAFDIELY